MRDLAGSHRSTKYQQYPLDEDGSIPMSRILVTENMLEAYAKMRGLDEGNGGPLWQSLFIEADPDFKRGAKSPTLMPKESIIANRRLSSTAEINESRIHEGVRLFWHLGNCHFQQPPPPPEKRHLKRQKPAGELRFSYCQSQDPPRFKPLHYKGEDAYGNYGYISINGTWVDPDSPGDVKNALYNLSNPAGDSGELPGSKQTGPRVLAEDEANSEYTKYIDYVSDEEGDPRDGRISPFVFACWAVGAQRGDRYVEKEVPLVSSP